MKPINFFYIILLWLSVGLIPVYANHSLELRVYTQPYNVIEKDVEAGVLNIQDNYKSVILTTKGYLPSFIDYNAYYAYVVIEPYKSNLVLSVTKKMPIELISSKVLTYLRESNPYCYLSFGVPMKDRCTTTLAYEYNFNLTSNFNYIYPGNYLFKIIRTFNGVKVEKR